MKIEQISISVFELAGNTGRFNLEEESFKATRRWTPRRSVRHPEQVHVMHVRTDEGVEGINTVGDARYTTIRHADLEQLRVLTVGADPFDRERLNAKLQAATRGMFAKPGWYGAFDNCLWDIAGKACNRPVYSLIGRAREHCPAYYNFGGASIENAVDDALAAVDQGFRAAKDHFHGWADQNIAGFAAVRAALGPNIDLLHDAALCQYSDQDALRVGRALEDLQYGWYEEPLADTNQIGLQRLCAQLDIPVLAPESMMHDMGLCTAWLLSGTTDYLRANARHGTTSLLKLAHLAELLGARIELNGPGGLFGLVHAHLVCSIQNTSYYEYFPGGSRDEIGKEIGLLNPPLPDNGHITPPSLPGWGAQWDWSHFAKQRVAEL